MNEVDELVTAMLAIAFAAVMLVAGGLYIDRPMQPPTVPAAANGVGATKSRLNLYVGGCSSDDDSH